MGKGRKGNTEDDNLGTEGFTDDAIMAKAISNYVRKGKHTGPIIIPQ